MSVDFHDNYILQKAKLLEFHELLDNPTYLAFFNSKRMSFQRTMSSLNYLNNVSEIISSYEKKIEKADDYNEGGKLLSIFGLFQGLFVGIDSLYELSKGVTKRKWSVNVNQNNYLKQIKYIRNDIVGHPSFRKYSNTDIGFCRLETDNISFKRLDYSITTFVNGSEHQDIRTIKIDKIINNYFIETNNVLDDIYSRIEYEKTAANKDLSFCFTDDVFKLYEAALNGSKNVEAILNKLKLSYVELNGEVRKTDRFLWRISLIKVLSEWKENSAKRNELVKYMLAGQITKLHSMSLQIDKDSGTRFMKSKLAPFKIPTLLKYFYKPIQENPRKLRHDLNVFQDLNHPLFNSAVLSLKSSFSQFESVVEIMNWMIELKGNQDKAFLLGSEIKRVKKK